MKITTNSATLVGVLLVAIYTVVMSAADGVTKLFAGAYAAPQLFFFSGALVAILCVVVSALSRAPSQALRTAQPWAMALRASMTVVAAVCFYYAFGHIPLAEVFIFIGIMPILAGLLARPMLNERVSPLTWIALAAGAIGVVCLFPEGVLGIGFGHVMALLACLSGTVSMILARYIGARENRPLALVFYPNLALCLVMGMVLPLVYQPMALQDFGWAALYATLLFAGRYLVVHALNLMSAHTVMALVNMQFVWMVLIGAAFFDEKPGVNVFVGAAIVIASGLLIIYDQARRSRRSAGPNAPANLPYPPRSRDGSALGGADWGFKEKSSSHNRTNWWRLDSLSQNARQSAPR
ncbi:DMT family transporter [Poseidonocella sedimentorum]|uniref:Permease of the drug/metabolite transporter (DMT) superfamily n=1 Tax=Poseidonocella sedimentorum TaxID=871652 RepID=A0A1I6DFK5_9RHOB|nr:DMT family transporter [Poseidonocella sedimentorum]SFR04280.1 Permease of the drug/metabolite transporter (DMT) superfamily [Poseidonocella sedimentorum]